MSTEADASPLLDLLGGALTGVTGGPTMPPGSPSADGDGSVGAALAEMQVRASSLAYIFGKDDTEGIVGLSPVDVYGQDSGGQAYMRVYRRERQPGTLPKSMGGGPSYHLVEEDEPFHPLFFLRETWPLNQFDRERYKRVRLKGDSAYQFLCVFDNWGDYRDAIKVIRVATGTDAEDDEGELPPLPNVVFTPGGMEAQYLMQTGRTMFKGMAFAELHRMQLDIETYTERDFPNAEREEDIITIISLTDNRGYRKLLHMAPGVRVPHGESFASERDMLVRLVEIIREDVNPDVIEMHNGFNFDLPYIMERCYRHDVAFAIGRDGSVPFTYDTERRFAEKEVKYRMCKVNGRHVVDTLFQVMAYDVIKRTLGSYGLKYCAKHFGFADETRTYVEGADIPRVWKEDPERLLRYALDDTLETERLARHLSGSSFYLTQMIPLPYADVERYGTGTKIQALFVREYLRQRQSIPAADFGKQSEGGYTDLYVRGVVDRLVYADVSSLYPAIMRYWECKPGAEKDPLDLFPRLLIKLTDLRLDAKAKMNSASGTERSELDARQGSFKVLINSMYGWMGFSMSLWNNFSEADRVATTGQGLLKQLIRLIEGDGGRVIEVDTDGVLFTPSDALERSDEAEAAYVRSLTERMPEGIEIDHDGSFAQMFSYKKKNYVLVPYGDDGSPNYDKAKFKGSSLVSRSYEPFGKAFVREVVISLLKRNPAEVHETFMRYHRMILERAWEAGAFRKMQTLRVTLDEYKRLVALGSGNGGRAKSPAYEAAIRDAAENGTPYVKGDRVSYYVAGADVPYSRVSASEQAKLVRDFDPDNPDECTSYYYRKRFESYVKKFRDVLSDEAHNRLFTPSDGLFGFDGSGIRIANWNVRPPLTDSDLLSDEHLPDKHPR